jgi:hypothetical protein
VRATWGRFEQDVTVLPLERGADGAWHGTLFHDEREKPIAVRYIEDEGLAYDAATR